MVDVLAVDAPTPPSPRLCLLFVVALVWLLFLIESTITIKQHH
jgi:hypothetical protein